MSHHQAIKEKATELNNSQLHMFTDHVKVINLILRKTVCFFVQVIGDGAFFSQLMQMKDGYTDGHSGEWFTRRGTIKLRLLDGLNEFRKPGGHGGDDASILGGGKSDPRAYQWRSRNAGVMAS